MPFPAVSQNDSVAKNAIYLDLGGVGVFGSLNYSRQFLSINKFDFDAHIGISSTKIIDFRTKFNPQIILPFGLHGAFGKTHYLELGVGCAYVNSVLIDNKFNPKREYTFNGNSSIGYKFKKKQGGFLFRIYYSPIFEQFKKIRHWGGLSLGYAF